MFRKILLGLVVVGCLGFSFSGKVLALEDRGGFVIDNFEVDILVNQDSTLEVVEKIEVDFSEKRHGIFRDIPVKYKNDQGFEYNMKLKVLSVENEQGKPYQFEISNYQDDKRIKIGSPSFEVIGEQVYVVRYEIKKGIRYFEEHDELYWNPVGTGWPTSIEKASSRVRFEDGVNFISQTGLCYTGEFASREKNCLVRENAKETLFESSKPLDAYEGMTIVLNFPKGEIYQPTKTEYFWMFLADNWGFGLPIIIFVLMFVVWFKKGRDQDFKKTLIAQYEVPDNLTPGEVGYLMKERYSGRFLAGDIVNLAVKGYLKIVEISKKNVISPVFFQKINLLKNIKITHLLFFLLVAFFINLNLFIGLLILIIILKFFNLQRFKLKEYQFEKLKDWKNIESLTKHEKRILEGIFKSKAIGSKVRLKERVDFYQDKKEIDSRVKGQISAKNYFLNSFWNKKIVYVSIGLLFLVLFFILGIFKERVDFILGGILSFPIILFFSLFMSKKSSKGAEAFWKTRGFKHYIDIAENDRSKFYAKENMFEQVLPYAIVFGNVDKWAKAFDGIIKEPPDWYSGSDVFNVIVFSNALNNGIVYSSNSAAVSPSSSGSGGSGSSGGGGGGGGGGSW
jgi:uncharacterized membrane protein YgcG